MKNFLEQIKSTDENICISVYNESGELLCTQKVKNLLSKMEKDFVYMKRSKVIDKKMEGSIVRVKIKEEF